MRGCQISDNNQEILIGEVGDNGFEDDGKCIEFLYWKAVFFGEQIAEETTHEINERTKGVMTACVQACISYMFFTNENLAFIRLGIKQRNARSLQVAENMGMRNIEANTPYASRFFSAASGGTGCIISRKDFLEDTSLAKPKQKHITDVISQYQEAIRKQNEADESDNRSPIPVIIGVTLILSAVGIAVYKKKQAQKSHLRKKRRARLPDVDA